MSTVLDKIKAYKLEDVAARKAARPLAEVETAARDASPVRGFANALTSATESGYGLIAEVKKASPSKGLIRADFDPPAKARALGADCILIIMASVGDEQAQELEDAAFSWGMDVLIEVHDEAELERALSLKCSLLGVNNRNLKTFETTLDTTRRLSKLAPADRHLVCESGLSTPQNLADMAAHGARRFLIGESLMRQDDVEAATRAILSNPVPA